MALLYSPNEATAATNRIRLPNAIYFFSSDSRHFSKASLLAPEQNIKNEDIELAKFYTFAE
jgi:hypothetical protein